MRRKKKLPAGKKFQKTLKEMARPVDKLIEQRQEMLAAQKSVSNQAGLRSTRCMKLASGGMQQRRKTPVLLICAARRTDGESRRKHRTRMPGRRKTRNNQGGKDKWHW
nr:hypothetical protein [uncultured Selenomonas sp.]